MQRAFLITIDTEGDSLWSRPSSAALQTRNAEFLPRFQQLCERHGFKPTYLTNYEMAISGTFCEMARDALSRGTAEVGMHLHAWNSPPLHPLTSDDDRYHPYLIDFPRDRMREKVAFMTDLLEDRFGRKMRSHRAGRWAFNETYAELLLERGYCVDCSVTPGVSWKRTRGAPGRTGSDYTNFPETHYFVDPGDVSRPGSSALLEVPMTIRRSWAKRHAPSLYEGAVGRVLRRFSPEVRWFRPTTNNAGAMHALVDWAVAERRDYLEFMLHSSELMPGGSPVFADELSIEKLYEDLAAVFAHVAEHFVGRTLSEYHDQVLAGIGARSVSDNQVAVGMVARPDESGEVIA